MKILATIKAALKKAGIPEKYAAKVQALFNIESEENLDNYIELFKENILPDLVSNEQSKQSEIDAAIAAYEKKNGLKDGKPIEKPAPKGKKTKKTKDAEEEEEEDDNDEEEEFKGVPASMLKLFKAQQKQLSELTESVTTLTGSISTSGKQASAKVLFDNAKLPEKWFNRIDVNSETSVEDQIKDLSEEYKEIRQSAVSEEVEAGNYRPYVAQPKDRTEKEWVELMNKEEGAGESSGVASLGIE